ncbi:Scr1 family TA system antitoxin-like transcriptional regulator [Spirillospora sp. NPDC050679]
MLREQDDQPEVDPYSSPFALYAHKMRRYRLRDGLTQTEVGLHCVVSPKLISAIEMMRRLPNEDVSKRLDGLHEVDFFEDQYHQILRVPKMPSGFREYMVQEAQADSIRLYEPLFIPGLLQTEAFMRALFKTWQSPQHVDQAVAIRLGRQDIFERADPPYVAFLIKESALREPVADQEVMRGQYAHLLEMGRRPNVTIQVIPSGAPFHTSGAFIVLDFAEGGGCCFVEAAVKRGYLFADPLDLHEMRVQFDLGQSVALPTSDTERFIMSLMEGP